MTELRWYVPATPGPQTARLQYRFADNGQPWSTWIDVPTVVEPPPGPPNSDWPQIPIIFTGSIR